MTASGLTIAAIMGVMLLVFIFSGYYLFAALGGAAIISGLVFWGPNVFQTIYFSIFKYCKDYNLLAVPLFVLMGQLLNQSGVAGRLFDNLSVALGRQRGGMAVAATLIAILFAATTGIVGASVVSMGLLFTKPMLDAKYNKSLTAGVIIAGGTLGILIPPSIMLVFMGSAANVSVGKLFYGAMTPGVLLGAAYIVYVKVISIVKKDYAPPMPDEVLSRYSKKQIAWGIIVNVLPVAIVIFSVLGAIWLGWCPATEAAALGVAASFLIALCTHSINKEVIRKTLVESIKLTSMVYAVSAFGNLFVTVFMRLGCSSAVTSLFVNLPLGKWGLFALMMAVVFLLGFLMDWIAVCMITIPIFVPIATQVGFQAEYFLTMMAVIMQTAFLSPPMAASIFYFQGVAKDHITTAETIRGVWPFMGIQVVVFVLCVIFPQIVTWLPNMIIS
ncbi:MAG: TRAP transporter large permease subunit [Oscillospiraceae bacterium]|mgnify:FL=1|uniref:TRAP transporter large permease n=1 Tax=Candidatus Limivicinus sp. TaxID=3030905 RepID=UPI002ECCE927|nr:TRAP transporter large permease subunit [Oscillospiraceae bacterium]